MPLLFSKARISSASSSGTPFRLKNRIGKKEALLRSSDWIRRQRLQPLIGQCGADCEMIHALQRIAFDTEQVMHCIVKVTADARAPHTRRFGLEVEYLA